MKIELPPGVPRSPKKDAADLFDLRDSSDSDRNPKSLEASRSSGSSLTPPTRGTTAKPHREKKKTSIEEPKAGEEKPDVPVLANQVETSSEWSVSRVVSNTVNQDGAGQGEVEEDEKVEEDGGEVRGGKVRGGEVPGGENGRGEEIAPRSTPFRSRQVCSCLIIRLVFGFLALFSSSSNCK